MEQEEQLLIPKEQVTEEVLDNLAASSFFKVVNSTQDSQDVEETTLCFCKFSTPYDLASLRKCCESGKDIILLPQYSSPSAQSLLSSFNYVLSKTTKVAMPHDSSLHCYYTKRFDEQVKIDLQPEYCNRNKRSGIKLSDYTVKYKSFTLNENKKIVLTSFKPASDVLPEQKVGIAIEIDISGSESDDSILMQVMSFRVGTVKAGFCENEQFFGYYPDQIKLFIEPKHSDPTLACIPVLVVPDGNLGEVSYSITKDQISEVTDQANLEVAINTGIFTIKPKVGAQKLNKERETVPGASLAAVYEGSNSQVFEWSIENWGDGGLYRREKPHSGIKRLEEWRKLPYRGTGPIITGINRIRWKVPDRSILADLSFDLTVETMMVLLEKKSTWKMWGRKFLAAKSSRVQVTHKAVIQLQVQ